MKITKLLKMTRSHILRVILCSIATMSILIIVGILNRVYMYIFIRWNLDLVQNDIGGSVPVEVAVVVVVWNYVVGIVVAGLLWQHLGIPKITAIGKCYKRFMDIYYIG